jgi:threonine/homoserine/homoserine lactone efflux protein
VMFSIFGGASIIVGVLLMAWVGWRAWRDGGGSNAVNG